MDDKIKDAIDVLKSGTAERKFSWHKSERENEYILRLESGAITVDRWVFTDQETGEDNDVVDISFLNSEGEIVDNEICSATDLADYRLLISLHNIARRNAMKIDETLEGIFNEIKKIAK